MAPAIRTENLTKRFGDLTAVDALDLHVEEGEIFGFLGPNGAGKSTTINVLLDFLRPTDGRAEVLGYDTHEDPIAIRQRTGVLPEGFSVYDRLTALEHVEYAIETKDASDAPRDLLSRVHLQEEAWERRAGEFSKGMTQRLALAMALVDDPDLLVLDEPSSGLDPTGIQEMRDIIREEADRGTTVFFSSHQLPQVEAVCDRVGIMRDGSMAAVDTIDNLRDDVGGATTIELEVDPMPAADALELGAVDGVEHATGHGDAIEVTCSDPRAKVDVVKRVDAATTVTDIVSDETDLEELFNQYTSGDGVDRGDREAEAEVSA
jgi:ABC-2 type transport system ATP-binding protein